MTSPPNSNSPESYDLTPTYLLKPNDFRTYSDFEKRFWRIFPRLIQLLLLLLLLCLLWIFDFPDSLVDVSYLASGILVIYITVPLLLIAGVPRYWSRYKLFYLANSILFIVAIFFIYLFNLFEPRMVLSWITIHLYITLLIDSSRGLKRATYLHLTRRIRWDSIVSRTTPYRQPQFWLNRATNLLQNWLSPANWKLWIFILLFVGGIVTPSIFHFVVNVRILSRSANANQIFGVLIPPNRFTLNLGDEIIDFDWSLTPLQLMTIGLVTTAVLVTVYILYRLIADREKYIVLEFGFHKDDPELEMLAQLTRRLLISELQEIASLLRNRQIRNVNISREDANAFFVTTGFDIDLLKQLEQIGNVEVGSSGRLNLGAISSLFLQATAWLTIRGNVQRSSKTNVNLTVNLHLKNRAALFEGATLERETYDQSFDLAKLRSEIRTLALKLLVATQQVNAVGNSTEALDQFLRGLKASSKQNWWQAISHYYATLEVLQDHRNSQQGVIYFHLASALTFQGRWEEGYRMLRRAEEYGPPLPETQYMLALVALYTYWGVLNEADPVVKEIEYRCRRALQMRPKFPEIYQLLGILYYRCARIDDRDPNSSNPNRLKQSRDELYRLANHNFRKALSQYDLELTRLQQQARKGRPVDSNYGQIVRQRAVTGHQVADSLRGLKFYAEAEQYYLDAQVLLPTNVRNLADLLKTYVNGRAWQRAQEILYRVALRQETARWEADVLYHAAWLLVGGANEIFWDTNHKRALIARSFGYLDYAIYTRPRYVKEWRQNGAIETFLRVAYQYARNTEDELPSTFFYTSPNVDDPGNHNERVFFALLALRIHDLFTDKDEVKEIPSDFIDKLGNLGWMGQLGSFADLRQKYLTSRNKIVEREIRSRRSKRFSGLALMFDQVDYAVEMYSLWTTAKSAVASEPETSSWWLSPTGRLKLDIYIRISMLAARALSRAEMLEELLEVSTQSCKLLKQFVHAWRGAYGARTDGAEETIPNNPDTFFGPTDHVGSTSAPHKNTPLRQKERSQHFTLSPYVFRFQRASLLGWAAIASLREFERSDRDPQSIKYLFDSQQYHTDASNDLIPIHPLVMFARAQILAHEHLYAQAIEELKRLLDVIDPFDPKQDIGRITKEYSPAPTTNEDRNRLYHLERVVGRQQFHNIVNPTTIHRRIAEYSFAMGEYESCARHLNEAIRLSSFTDTDLEVLIELAQRLIELNAFDDALSVISAARIPRESLLGRSLSETKRRMPDVLEAVVFTQQFRHADALRLAQTLAKNFIALQPADFVDLVASAYPEEGSDFFSGFNKYTVLIQANQLDAKECVKASFKWINDNIVTNVIEPNAESSFGDSFKDLFSYFGVEHKPGSDNQDIIFPRLYRKLSASKQLYSKTLNTIASISLFALRTDYQEALRPKEKVDKFKIAHMVGFHSREAVDTLAQLAELCNCLAYNRIETGTVYRVNHAFVDVMTAIYIMSYLCENCHDLHPRRSWFKAKLAQYCDTLAWLVYRVPDPSFDVSKLQGSSGIECAKHLLRISIRYDHTVPMTHYHYAYICIEHVETLKLHSSSWARIELKEHFDEIEVALETAKQNDRYAHLNSRIKELESRFMKVKAHYDMN
jgi:tetratricopeptide (TPR) repeat protein